MAHFIPLIGTRRDKKTADSAIGGRKSGPSFALLERVHPVGFEVIKREHQRAQAPGDRIGPGDRLQYGKEFHGEGDVGHADDAPAQQHHQHRHGGFARAAEDGGHAVRIRQQEEERRAQEAANNRNNGGNNNQGNSGSGSGSGGNKGNGGTTSGSSSSYVPGDAVSRAQSALGKPYVWGAVGPDAFDCSGLVGFCLTGKYKRTYTSSSFAGLPEVSDPRPGDVCYRPGHVGIYVGNGQMIHAPHTGSVVKYASVPSNMIIVRP